MTRSVALPPRLTQCGPDPFLSATVQVETINRLLKAAPGRRGKAATTSSNQPTNANSRDASPPPPPAPTLFRTVTSIRSGEYTIALSVPPALDFLAYVDAALPPAQAPASAPRSVKGVCAIEGCGKERKYRCVGGREAFEVGGCGIDHLKIVQERVKASAAMA